MPTFTAASVASTWPMSDTTCDNYGPVTGQPTCGLRSNVRLLSVTENANSVLPTSIATTTVEDVTGAA